MRSNSPMRGFKVKEGRVTALDLMLTNADAHIRLTVIGLSAWELDGVVQRGVAVCGQLWYSLV